VCREPRGNGRKQFFPREAAAEAFRGLMSNVEGFCEELVDRLGKRHGISGFHQHSGVGLQRQNLAEVRQIGGNHGASQARHKDNAELAKIST
jgi:hypothetical protein